MGDKPLLFIGAGIHPAPEVGLFQQTLKVDTPVFSLLTVSKRTYKKLLTKIGGVRIIGQQNSYECASMHMHPYGYGRAYAFDRSPNPPPKAGVRRNQA